MHDLYHERMKSNCWICKLWFKTTFLRGIGGNSSNIICTRDCFLLLLCCAFWDKWLKTFETNKEGCLLFFFFPLKVGHLGELACSVNTKKVSLKWWLQWYLRKKTHYKCLLVDREIMSIEPKQINIYLVAQKESTKIKTPNY